MFDHNGWVKIHRKILRSPIFDNANLLKVWVWCLCKATHEPQKHLVGNQLVELEAGQFVFGRKAAAEELKLSDSSVYRYMQTLQKLEMLNIKSNNKFSVVTVMKWDFYQGRDDVEQQQDEQQVNSNRTTSEQQVNTNKNVKNNNLSLTFSNEKLKDKYLTLSNERVCQTQSVRLAIEAWNTLTEFGIKGVTKVSSGSKRYQSLMERIGEYGLEDVLEAIEKIKGSDFLQGKNDRGWVVTFDWFVLPNNFPKVLEGNYDNKEEHRGTGKNQRDDQPRVRYGDHW